MEPFDATDRSSAHGRSHLPFTHSSTNTMAMASIFAARNHQQKRTPWLLLLSCWIGYLAIATSTLRKLANAPTYQEGTAQQKHAYLMEKILEDTTSRTWTMCCGRDSVAWTFVMNFVNLRQTFLHDEDDEQPPGRYRTIHQVAAVASVRVKWNQSTTHGYTGIFTQDVDYGIIRLGSAGKPTEGLGVEPSASGFAAGMALKLLRDGVPSANVVTVRSSGAQSWNFFHGPLTNHISHKSSATPVASTSSILLFSKTLSRWTTMVGLQDFGRFGIDGSKVSDEEISFPYQVIFWPTEEMQALFPDEFESTLTEQLKVIPLGTMLYHIYTKSDYYAAAEHIGDIILTSTLQGSKFGDERLFFRHQFMDDDFDMHPEWQVPECVNSRTCNVCPYDYSCF